MTVAGRAEQLFNQLRDSGDVVALIGEAEDAHLDCKEWPVKDDDAQKMLAKAACGLANADGGVLVIGMKAESKPKDEPDVITAAAPVSNTSLVKSRLLGLIGQLVEPPIVGIEAREIADVPNSTSGFVVVHVPKCQGSPCRSRKDWKFYQRVGSASLPMEYGQIEVMFGKRPHPKLELHIEPLSMVNGSGFNPKPLRPIVFGVRNDGAGIAKFPGLRFKRAPGLTDDNFGIDGNGGLGLPRRPSEVTWLSYRGGVDDVIYPGETRLVSKLFQLAHNKGIEGIPITQVPIVNNRIVLNNWVCPPMTLFCELSSEGTQTRVVEVELNEDSLIVPANQPF